MPINDSYSIDTEQHAGFLNQLVGGLRIDFFRWFDEPRYVALRLPSGVSVLLFASDGGFPAFIVLAAAGGEFVQTDASLSVSEHAKERIRPDVETLISLLEKRPTIEAVELGEAVLFPGTVAWDCLMLRLKTTTIAIQSDLAFGSLYANYGEDGHGWPTIEEDLWVKVATR